MRLLSPLILCLLPLLSWGQTHTEDYVPYRDVEATDSGIVVTYTFRGGIHQIDPLHDGAKFWKIPGFGLNDNVGEPGFPFRWDTFTIPDNADVYVTLLDSAYTDTLFTIAPSYPPLLNSDTIGYTPERVPAITPYTGFYPNNSVQKGDIQSYRGQGLVRVATLPVQYNFQTGTVRTFSRIKYLVSFTDRNTRSKIRGRNYVSESADSRISYSDHFLENTTLNYKLSTNGRKNVQDKGGGTRALNDNKDYLIISTPTYAEAVNRFADWKRTKGFRTHVLLRNDWTVTSVKTSIMDLYNTEGVNLYYLLIVGGANDVPAYENNNIGNITGNHVTDYYYGCIEDTILSNESRNIIASVKRGRIPVCEPDDAERIINKIITYEQMPPVDSVFYKNGLNVGFFEDKDNKPNIEDRRFVFTCEEIKTYMESQGKNVQRIYYAGNNVNPLRWNNDRFAFGDSIPIYLRKPTYNWNGSSSDIVNGINNGAFYVLYRGHGETDGWVNYIVLSEIPLFKKYNVFQLTNGNRMPVVFSMTCHTGAFDRPGGLLNHFLRHLNGGCVAMIAASDEAYSGYDDALTYGLFNSIWPNPGIYIQFPNPVGNSQYIQQDPIWNLGAVLDTGFSYMDNTNYSYLINPIKEEQLVYQKEIFHLFGDPSMMIYTEQPTEISEPSIVVRSDVIFVNTTDGRARVTFYTPGPNPVVDSYLGTSFHYNTTADSVIICIDRHNCIPYIATYHRNEFIQNENINDTRTYLGKNIKVGRNVTTTKPEGDVIIDGANMVIRGGNVELHPGTTITNSNVVINPQ